MRLGKRKVAFYRSVTCHCAANLEAQTNASKGDDGGSRVPSEIEMILSHIYLYIMVVNICLFICITNSNKHLYVMSLCRHTAPKFGIYL